MKEKENVEQTGMKNSLERNYLQIVNKATRDEMDNTKNKDYSRYCNFFGFYTLFSARFYNEKYMRHIQSQKFLIPRFWNCTHLATWAQM